MAPLSSKAVALVALSSLLVTFAAGAGTFNDSAFTADPNWEAARATWYGAPTGAGPDDDGGACGFKNVNQYPFSAMTSCGNEPIFKDGKGCGSCYQIRCVTDQSCSGNPETIVITDMNYYPVSKYHFDLSGTAFGALAKPGLNDKLRHSGIIDIQFKRGPTRCISRCWWSTRTATATWCRWTSWRPTPGRGRRCGSRGVPSGGWTRATASRRPSPCASPTSPARRWWRTRSSRPTGRPAPSTAPSSSTAEAEAEAAELS